ncbi:MAG: NADP-dependent oxidoreductase [Myxococcota bacterium]
MKAVYIRGYGGAEVLEYGEIPLPKMKPHQILIEVHASSVNPIDWKIRGGKFRYLPIIRFPLVLGFDVAGVVAEVGAVAGKFKVGDEVIAMLPPFGGAYAEFVAAGEKLVAGKPRNISFEEASTMPLAGLTAYQALVNHSKMKAGDRILIIGASGGVGSFAVQIAKALGAGRIAGVCGAKNGEFVTGLGANEVLDYAKDDMHKLRGYDIVFDVFGRERFRDIAPILTPQGTFISTEPHIHTIPSALFSLTRNFVKEGKKAKVFNCAPNGDDLAALAKLVEEGKVRPVIDKIFPLDKLADAHRYNETRHARGKVAIKIKQ